MGILTNESSIFSSSGVLSQIQTSVLKLRADKFVTTANLSLRKPNTTQLLLEARGFSENQASRDLFGCELSLAGNSGFLAVYATLCLIYLLISIRSRYRWVNACFVCGYAFEFVAYLGRVLAINNHGSIGFFVMQNSRFGLAPLFISTGILFIFVQTATVYGAQYCFRRPVWYLYSYIAIEQTSLIVLAIGGGLTARSGVSTVIGESLMLAGTIFEALLMAALLFFSLRLVYTTSFQSIPNDRPDSKYWKPSVTNYLQMLVNARSACSYKCQELDQLYNPRYQGIRLRDLFHFYPLVIAFSASVLLARCVYRVLETKQGYRGYLSSQEASVFTLDSFPILLVGLLFVPFHPLFVFGKEIVLRLVDLTQGVEVKEEGVESDQARKTFINRDSNSPVHSPTTTHQPVQVLYML